MLRRTLALIALQTSHVCGRALSRPGEMAHGSFQRRQVSSTSNWTDPNTWCQDLDITDPATVQNFWENSPIGGTFGVYLEDSINPPDQNWPFKMMSFTNPEVGDPGISDCGAIGGTDCNPQIDCLDMASRGEGSFYWILQALIGFQSKINTANSLLQSSVIADILEIDQIAQDFSTPMTSEPLGGVAGLLSAIFFLAAAVSGGAAEGADIAIDEGVTVGAESALGAAKWEYDEALGNDAGLTGDALAAALAKAQQNEEYAQARLDAITAEYGYDDLNSIKSGAGAASAPVVLMGSIFNQINAVHSYEDEHPSGQVSTAAVSNVLETLFSEATEQLQSIATLVVGGPGNGSNPYAALPGYPGSSGPAYKNNSIATFFSDGRFLLGGGNNTVAFEQTILAGYGLLRKKLVDYALQSAGYMVLSLPDTTSSNCGSTYGAQWIPSLGSGVCLMLFQQLPNPVQCSNVLGYQGGGTVFSCTYVQAGSNVFDTMQNTYQINMFDYYSYALGCAVNGTGSTDTQNLPIDGSLPLCFYNPLTQNAEFQGRGSSSGTIGPNDNQWVSLSNFTKSGS